MANVIGQADILIRGDASEFTRDLNQQTKPAQSWGKRMGTLAKKALGRAMKVGLAGIGVAAGAAIIGGVIASGMLWVGLHYIVQGWLAPTLGQQLITVGVADLVWAAPLLIALGAVLSIASSVVSLNRYLKV